MIEHMRDAAYAGNVGKDWPGAVGGYLHTGDPYHPWSKADWARFPRNRKLPIVAMSHPGGRDPETDAFGVLQELYDLRVPKNVPTALDLETAVDFTYVAVYGAILHWNGYRVWPYGSTSSLFQNPQLHGYWVAAPSKDGQPYMYQRAGALIQATQYRDSIKPGYDSSTVRWWAYRRGLWWV